MMNKNYLRTEGTENFIQANEGGLKAARNGGPDMTNTLVIHPSDRSTQDLNLVHEGLRDIDLITDTRDREMVLRKVRKADRVIFLGHGVPQGLIGTGMRLAVDSSFAEALRTQPRNIFVWCNASNFVMDHALTGFATSMFISEPAEAFVFNVEATPAQLTYSNRLFSRLVREAIDADLTNEEMAEYVLEGYYDPTNAAMVYNRQRIFAFEKGVITVSAETIDHGFVGHNELGRGVEARPF